MSDADECFESTKIASNVRLSLSLSDHDWIDTAAVLAVTGPLLPTADGCWLLFFPAVPGSPVATAHVDGAAADGAGLLAPALTAPVPLAWIFWQSIVRIRAGSSALHSRARISRALSSAERSVNRTT